MGKKTQTAVVPEATVDQDEVDFAYKMAKAMAKANDHPDPAEYADKVVEAFVNPDEEPEVLADE